MLQCFNKQKLFEINAQIAQINGIKRIRQIQTHRAVRFIPSIDNSNIFVMTEATTKTNGCGFVNFMQPILEIIAEKS